jgi:hypothetical protein
MFLNEFGIKLHYHCLSASTHLYSTLYCTFWCLYLPCSNSNRVLPVRDRGNWYCLIELLMYL